MFLYAVALRFAFTVTKGLNLFQHDCAKSDVYKDMVC